MDYRDVFEAIVAETRDAIGDVALRQAQSIEDVEIAGDGTVTGTIDAGDIEDLLERYRDLMKQGADAHARRAVKRLYRDDRTVTDLDLPDSIMPVEVRADRFASAL